MTRRPLPRGTGHADRMLPVLSRLDAIRGDESFAAFAARLGVHPENMRRYLHNAARMPASCLVAAVHELGIDGHWILTGDQRGVEEALRSAQTEQLLSEIARRLAVGGSAAEVTSEQRSAAEAALRILTIAGGPPWRGEAGRVCEPKTRGSRQG
jgi:hypothetical protein